MTRSLWTALYVRFFSSFFNGDITSCLLNFCKKNNNIYIYIFFALNEVHYANAAVRFTLTDARTSTVLSRDHEIEINNGELTYHKLINSKKNKKMYFLSGKKL